MDSCDRFNGICTNTSGCRPGWKPEIDKCDVGKLLQYYLLLYRWYVLM